MNRQKMMLRQYRQLLDLLTRDTFDRATAAELLSQLHPAGDQKCNVTTIESVHWWVQERKKRGYPTDEDVDHYSVWGSASFPLVARAVKNLSNQLRNERAQQVIQELKHLIGLDRYLIVYVKQAHYFGPDSETRKIGPGKFELIPDNYELYRKVLVRTMPNDRVRHIFFDE